MNTKEFMEVFNSLKNKGIDLNTVNENYITQLLENRNNHTTMINLHTKMDWLVSNLLNGVDNRTKLVQNVNKNMEKQNFGVVRAPTGIGKSGIIYTDIFNRITKNKDKKQIFIISNLHSDATENEYIALHQPESMWIIWTGLKEKDISMWIEKTPMYKHNMVKYIDRNDMNRVIECNANLITFWNDEINKWN